MKMIASGWTVSTIAEELKLSVKTVTPTAPEFLPR
jgi:DNA-binding NarL/FixJ family response regulator